METITFLPKFEGKPLIKIPGIIPVANFLEGDFGKEVLKEYGKRVSFLYHNNRVLKDALSYNKEDDIVTGSNPFAVVLVNQIIKEEGLRTASLADLQKIIDYEALDLGWLCEDAALVLRSEQEPNKYFAKNLSKQIKAREGKIKYPSMIPLSGLELISDSDAPRGLSFKLTGETELIRAPILNKYDSYFDNKNVDRETGLPRKIGNRGRHLYTNRSIYKGGLNALALIELNLVTGPDLKEEYTKDSSFNWRIVVVNDEVTSQNLRQEIIKRIDIKYKNQVKKLDEKVDRALSIIK